MTLLGTLLKSIVQGIPPTCVSLDAVSIHQQLLKFHLCVIYTLLAMLKVDFDYPPRINEDGRGRFLRRYHLLSFMPQVRPLYKLQGQ